MSSNSDEEIPDRCPACKKKVRFLLIHINARCYKEIDENLIEIWKKLAKRRSKKKYQAKYVEKGKHKLAQSKYAKKIRDEDEKSFLKVQKLKQSRYLNKIRFQIKKTKRRSKLFKDLCRTTLWFMKDGSICESYLMKFHLIEDEVCKKYCDLEGKKFDPDVAHSWIKEIDFKLLQSLITFHEVALVPRSIWLKALGMVSCDEEKLELKEKLFRLIGKLQAYNHSNTKDIPIPKEFKSRCKGKDEHEIPWTWADLPNDFSAQDQVLLYFTLEYALYL